MDIKDLENAIEWTHKKLHETSEQSKTYQLLFSHFLFLLGLQCKLLQKLMDD